MPVGVVKTKEDETKWNEAKKAADKYKDVSKGSDRYWKIVMGIFKKMKGIASLGLFDAIETAEAYAKQNKIKDYIISATGNHGYIVHAIGDVKTCPECGGAMTKTDGAWKCMNCSAIYRGLAVKAAKEKHIEPEKAKKIWVALDDAKTCKACRHMDGKEIFVDELFKFRPKEIGAKDGRRTYKLNGPPLHWITRGDKKGEVTCRCSMLRFEIK